MNSSNRNMRGGGLGFSNRISDPMRTDDIEGFIF